MKWYKKQLDEILKKKSAEDDKPKTEKVYPTSGHAPHAMGIKQGRVKFSPVKQRNNNRSKTDA
jgi:hypothetical protein